MAAEHRAVWGAERGEADTDGAAGIFVANAVGLGDNDLPHARHMELHAELAGARGAAVEEGLDARTGVGDISGDAEHGDAVLDCVEEEAGGAALRCTAFEAHR